MIIGVYRISYIIRNMIEQSLPWLTLSRNTILMLSDNLTILFVPQKFAHWLSHSDWCESFPCE